MKKTSVHQNCKRPKRPLSTPSKHTNFQNTKLPNYLRSFFEVATVFYAKILSYPHGYNEVFHRETRNFSAPKTIPLQILKLNWVTCFWAVCLICISLISRQSIQHLIGVNEIFCMWESVVKTSFTFYKHPPDDALRTADVIESWHKSLLINSRTRVRIILTSFQDFKWTPTGFTRSPLLLCLPFWEVFPQSRPHEVFLN